MLTSNYPVQKRVSSCNSIRAVKTVRLPCQQGLWDGFPLYLNVLKDCFMLNMNAKCVLGQHRPTRAHGNQGSQNPPLGCMSAALTWQTSPWGPCLAFNQGSLIQKLFLLQFILAVCFEHLLWFYSLGLSGT